MQIRFVGSLVGWSCFVRSAVRLAPAGGGLALRVEVDGGDGEAEVVLLSELAGAEAVLGRRRVHSLPALLPEQHKDEPVDANVRLWGLVAHHLSPCMYICMASIRWRRNGVARGRRRQRTGD